MKSPLSTVPRANPVAAIRFENGEPNGVGDTGAWWWSRGAAVVVWALAGWPVWRWYAARIGDGSDEPWGVVALLAALAFVPWRRFREPLPVAAACWAAAAVVPVLVGFWIMPALVRGGLWMVALVALLGGKGPWVARAGLLALSLPVVATAQFYLGYPLRAVTAACSVPLLHACGYAVTRQGTALRWAGETVLVDAPCSGIQMLWTGLFTACLLAASRGLGARGTWRLLRRAGIVVAGANVLRCVALFLVEIQGGVPADWLHESIGLVFFASALGVIAVLADQGGAIIATDSEMRAAPSKRVGSAGMRWTVVALVLLMAGVALRPFAEVAERGGGDADSFPGWPEQFDGRALMPLVFSEREARFAAGFPGRVGAFSDGERTILLRWVTRETRKLHPALHCLRGLGYAVQPGPVWRDGAGRNWGTTLAERDGKNRRVRERIADGHGEEWTDVSAWWWDAWWGSSTGPWWAVTVFED